uniref:MFS domain-containing protein n=1 Tax=Parastrongyloides trichosuri TaxID=131310 RepID=A0A0N4Z4C7_PARTI
MVPFRYIILFLGIISYAFLISNILTLNFAIVCDAHESNEERLIKFDKSQLNVLFSIIAVGNIVGTFPLQYVILKIGAKKTFFIYLLISAVSTLIFPFIVKHGYIPTLILRFFQGFAWAVALPGLGAMTYSWSPIAESGIYMTSLSSSGQAAPLITMYLSSQLCSHHLGSSSIFYVHAVVSFILLLIFYILYTDHAEDSKFVSSEEVKDIMKGKGVTERKKSHEPIPYKKVLFNPTLTLGNVTYFIYFLNMHLWMQYAAIYVNLVLEFDIPTTGVITSFPYFIGIFVKLLYGYLSDKDFFFKNKTILRMLQGSSQITTGIAFLILGFFATQFTYLDVTLYTIQVILGSAASVAIFKSCFLVSQQHFHFVMSIASIGNSVGLLVVPSLVNIIMPNYEIHGWRIIFLLIGGLTVVSNITFIAVMKTEPAKWTKSVNSLKEEGNDIKN